MSKVKDWFDDSVARLQGPDIPPEPAYKKVTVRLEVPICEKLDALALRLGPGSRTACAEELLTAAIEEADALMQNDEWVMSAEIHSIGMDEIEQLVSSRRAKAEEGASS